MNPYKAIRIQGRLQAGNGLLFQIVLALAVERHVVVLRLRVVQAIHRNDVDARPVLHHDSLPILLRRARGHGEFGGRRDLLSQPFPSPRNGLLKTVGAERFQQIVHRMGVKRAHGVLVERRNENHGDLPPNQFQHFKAVQLGHLNIQENQVGLVLGNSLHGLEAIAALGQDPDAFDHSNVLPYQLARQFFVIHDHDA